MGYKDKQEYKDEEKLILDKKVYITKEVWQILNRHYLKERKSGRRISKAKIVCNLIIKNLCH
jgi:hypothetical protein